MNSAEDSLDVSGYKLRGFFNRKTTSSLTPYTFPEGTVLAPKQLYTIGRVDSIFRSYYPCGADGYSTTVTANGDDVYAVFNRDSVIVDIYGRRGVDPDSLEWHFKESIVRRTDFTPNFGSYDPGDFEIITPGFPSEATPCEEFPTPFPVTLISFTGRLEPEGVVLEWSTAQEIDNDYFALEHSDDSVEYAEITSVPAGDPAGDDYRYTFVDPAAGIHYFRLRQVDLDGTVDTTATISVRVAGSEVGFGLAANVVDDELVVSRASDRALFVIAADGRLVDRFEGLSGQNRLSVRDLPAGIYVLSDGEVSLRFLRP